MYTDNSIYLGLADERVYLPLGQANRHGLIAGASGTGKTITMKVMAESFSDAGVPVFLCDVKGDVSGLAEAGKDNAGMQKRIDKFGIRDTFTYKPYPVTFWDLYGKFGHPIRATVSDMGPSLLARICDLTEIQEGILHIAFRVADDKGLILTDLKDLRAILNHINDRKKEYIPQYGNITAQSVGAILRALLVLENEGADRFFGEPALDITDWLRTDADGHGMIHILDSRTLISTPKLYATFLLWMMAELFETLPEVGDPEKPKLVFFFDEAHLLFNDAPKALFQKIEQTVKLIRSKGVGIYFVTQNPSDIPDAVLAQLSNRILHGLRAYTPSELKAVRAAAQSFRQNPAFDTQEAILSVGTGEAVVSLLNEKGVPIIAQKTAILCPQSLMAPCSESVRARCLEEDGMSKYDTAIDPESAYEVLAEEAVLQAEKDALEAEREAIRREREELEKQKQKEEEKRLKQMEKEQERQRIAAEKAIQKRRERIESQIISTGGALLRRGLLNILKRK